MSPTSSMKTPTRGALNVTSPSTLSDDPVLMPTNDMLDQPLEPSRDKPPKTPLPKLQLAIVCLTALAEPIAFSQIFPYINQMIEEMHITDDQSKIGFYSGLVDSLFSVAQLLTVYQWGKLSDRIGRKPVVIFGLCGVIISYLTFGLSTSFSQLLISRCMAGALSGNVAVIRSIMGDITDETNQAQAFPLGGVFFSVGMVIGPSIGGALSHPAERYPNVFGNFKLLRDKPYFLPNFASAIVTITCMLIAVIFLEESQPSKVRARKQKVEGASQRISADTSTQRPLAHTVKSYGSITPPVTDGDQLKLDPPVSLRALLSDKRIRGVLLSTFLLNFVTAAYDVVFILFSYTPIQLGGLSRTPSEIGVALAAIGFFGIPLSLVGFSLMHERFGTLPLYRTLLATYPIVSACMPALGWLARLCASKSSLNLSAVTDGLLWSAILLVMMIGRIGGTAYAANMILTKACTPNPRSLGSMFALGQTVSGIARAIAPAFASSLFAISIQKHILGGHFVWLVMTVIGCYGVWIARGLRM